MKTNIFAFVMSFMVCFIWSTSSKAQMITTVAGTSSTGYTPDGVVATVARLNGNGTVAFDHSGNMYFTEFDNHVVRKVTPSGTLVTVAGSHSAGYSGDGGPATAAQLNGPNWLDFDAAGNLYICEFYNNCVRKVNSAGIITTVAGTGVSGYNGDGIPAVSAQLFNPAGIAIDGANNLFIVDYWNQRIRKVNTSGVISTVAGNGSPGFSGDGGPAVSANLAYPVGMDVDNSGNLFICDNSNHRLRKVDASGTITTFAGGIAGYGGDGGQATAARLFYLNAVSVTPSGYVYICDAANNRVRVVSPTGVITTVAGNGSSGYSGDGGAATAAALNTGHIALDPSNNVHIYGNGVIRKVSCSSPVGGSIAGASSVCTGATITQSNPTATAGGVWTSSATGVATIHPSTGIVTGVAAGTTTISYTISNICGIASASRVITVNPTPGAITGTTTLCVNATATLGNAVGGGAWASSNSGIATVNATTGLLTGVSDGAATVTYTTGCGSATTSITINPLPAPITGTAVVCSLSTTTLANSTPAGDWTSANPTIASVDIATGDVTGGAAGNTTISYTLATGCFQTTTFTTLPLPSVIGGSFRACPGTTTALTNAVSGGVWTSDNSAVATVNSGTGVVTGVAAGTATISYAVTCGTVFTTVTINPLPAVIAGTTTSICAFTNTSFTNATGGGLWTSDNTGIATIGSASGQMTGVVGGNTFITYTMPATGCYRTQSVNIKPIAAIAGPSGVCVGQTATLTDAVTGGTWASANPTIARIGSTTGIITGVAGGVTSVTYTLASGCRVTAPITSSSLSAISGTATVCVGQTTTLTQVGSGVWSSGDISTATVGSGTGIVTGVAAGTATITYTIGGSCSATKVVTVNAAAAIAGPGSVCTGQSVTLTNSVSGGIWSSNSNLIARVGSTTGVVTGVAGGSVNISYTLGGCRTTYPVTVNSISGITGTTNIYAGQVVTLMSVGAGMWSSSDATVASIGSATGVLTGVGSGNALITYSLGTGCFTTTNVTVTVLPAVSGPSGVCVGQSTTLTNSTPGGTWVSGNTTIATINATTGLMTGITGGNVTITYNFPGGGRVTFPVMVNRLSPINGPTSVCAGQLISLFNTDCCGVWTTTSALASVGYSSGQVIGITPGTAVITYTLPTGCITATTITVKPLSPISGPGSVCAGQTITLSNATSGGTWTSGNALLARVGSASGIVTGVAAGVLSISYTIAATGCRATMPIIVSSCRAAGAAEAAIEANAEITVVPNPSNGMFVIKGALSETQDAEVTVDIMDMVGKTVFTKHFTAAAGLLNEQLQTNGSLANGVYLMNIHTEKEHKLIRVIITQ